MVLKPIHFKKNETFPHKALKQHQGTGKTFLRLFDDNNNYKCLIKRLDSSEMDHSENEDYTMSSPLPGKKSDKRDDSDLVRVRYLV